MDDGADAAALAGAALRTQWLPPEVAAQRLRVALHGHAGDLTIADAAARSGLPLRHAERGLHALLQTQRGHLSVTSGGELLFRFPHGLSRSSGAVATALRLLGAGAIGLVRWTARLALTAFLLGYGMLFAMAVLLAGVSVALEADDAEPVGRLAYVGWQFLELIFDVMYWGVHPLRGPDEFGGLEEGDHQPRHFYQRVNGFFLGPPRPRRSPEAAARLLTEEIRFRRGRIGLSDVVRVTGLAPEPANALVSRLLLDYDGTVEVSDEGAIVYGFAALQPSVGVAPQRPAPSIWQRARQLPTLTGNTLDSDMTVALLTLFVAGGGWLGVWFGLPVWAAEVPLVSGLAMLAMVLLRWPVHLARRRAYRAESGRRALLRRAYAAATEREGVPVEEFARVWRDAAGGELAQPRLEALLLEFGGDLEIDEQGQTAWRFPTIELELGALARVRAEVGTGEREVGEIEFSSLPQNEYAALLEGRGSSSGSS